MSIDQTVLEAKRYGVLSCEQNKTLLEAAQIMAREDVSALVIEDAQGYLAGLLSRTDLIKALGNDADWRVQLVSDYMARDVVCVHASSTLMEVARLLLTRQIHRVVVVREEHGKHRPIAVVSTADIVYHMAKDN
jgi:CBS domain-containing protein